MTSGNPAAEVVAGLAFAVLSGSAMLDFQVYIVRTSSTSGSVLTRGVLGRTPVLAELPVIQTVPDYWG